MLIFYNISDLTKYVQDAIYKTSVIEMQSLNESEASVESMKESSYFLFWVTPLFGN